MQKILEPSRYKSVLKKGLQVLGGLAETRIGLEAVKTVYSYIPKTNSYRRTGRLLGGRGRLSNATPNKEQVDDNTIKIVANPQLRGAKFNYAPFVNAGKGWMKRVGARPFWDNSITWIESKGVKRATEEMKKELKNILKK